jgi:hypothetical protein
VASALDTLHPAPAGALPIGTPPGTPTRTQASLDPSPFRGDLTLNGAHPRAHPAVSKNQDLVFGALAEVTAGGSSAPTSWWGGANRRFAENQRPGGRAALMPGRKRAVEGGQGGAGGRRGVSWRPWQEAGMYFLAYGLPCQEAGEPCWRSCLGLWWADLRLLGGFRAPSARGTCPSRAASLVFIQLPQSEDLESLMGRFEYMPVDSRWRL